MPDAAARIGSSVCAARLLAAPVEVPRTKHLSQDQSPQFRAPTDEANGGDGIVFSEHNPVAEIHREPNPLDRQRSQRRSMVHGGGSVLSQCLGHDAAIRCGRFAAAAERPRLHPTCRHARMSLTRASPQSR